MPILNEIWIYPVKSLPGIQLTTASIDKRGFQWDRHWMLVDENGKFVSQRQLPKMAKFSVNIKDGQLKLAYPGKPSVQIDMQIEAKQRVAVSVWGDSLEAMLVGKDYDDWFSDCLGVPVKLVSMLEDVSRQVDQEYAGPHGETGFSDGFPFLLLSQASIDDLNQRIDDDQQIMTVQRFRPNLVIADSLPYEEDSWRKIQIGEVTFKLVKPCSRCTITTVNPLTAEKGSEPLKTLASYRRKQNKVFFGQNAVHEGLGLLAQGDIVNIVS